MGESTYNKIPTVTRTTYELVQVCPAGNVRALLRNRYLRISHRRTQCSEDALQEVMSCIIARRTYLGWHQHGTPPLRTAL